MIVIVEGDAHDIASIMPVMEHAFDPAYGEAWTSAQCLSALAMPDCRLLIAKSGEDIAGFTISRWVLDIEELLMIGVAPEWQRRNVGSMLMSQIVSLAQEERRLKLFLEVREGNIAHDFYLAFGFQPIGRRKQYYRGSNGFRPDAITMAMNL